MCNALYSNRFEQVFFSIALGIPKEYFFEALSVRFEMTREAFFTPFFES